MGDRSAIPWTDATWNPIRGCSRVSEGCRNCYAERIAARFSGPGQPYEGLATMTPSGPRWSGKVELVESALDLPLRWRKPRRVFVNSMSDLFHEQVPDDWIDRVFSVIALAPQHTFQVLTKRPERMRAYLSDAATRGRIAKTTDRYAVVRAVEKMGEPRIEVRPGSSEEQTCHRDGDPRNNALPNLRWGDQSENWIDRNRHEGRGGGWPLDNVWAGVSVEDQATADERIPLLLQTPAAVRWVSYEPARGPVDFRLFLDRGAAVETRGLDWLVIGGESGPRARPFALAWARRAIAQCRAAGVPMFLKQLGNDPYFGMDDRSDWPAGVRVEWSGHGVGTGRPCLRDRKGADMAEWPEDLRVREFPR